MATAALFFGMHFVPALLGPPIVARLEHLPARRTLPALYAAEAARVRACWRCSRPSSSLVRVLALATFDGSIASAARALTRASAAAVLAPAGQLREGNALLNVAFTVGAAGGPAIAGLVVAGAGRRDRAARGRRLVPRGRRAARRSPGGCRDPEAERRREAAGASACAAASPTSASARRCARLLGAQALAFVFFALVIPIEVVFAKETLDAGDAGYGALLASWGVGDGRRQPAVRRACAGSRLPALLVVSTAGDRGRLPRHRGLAHAGASPAPPRWSAGSATGSSGSRW